MRFHSALSDAKKHFVITYNFSFNTGNCLAMFAFKYINLIYCFCHPSTRYMSFVLHFILKVSGLMHTHDRSLKNKRICLKKERQMFMQMHAPLLPYLLARDGAIENCKQVCWWTTSSILMKITFLKPLRYFAFLIVSGNGYPLHFKTKLLFPPLAFFLNLNW